MKWEEYQVAFNEILSGENNTAPYDNPSYLEYVKLNNSRMNRWLKKGVLTDEIKDMISSITEKQNWILITEPWCGDAAHLAPFFQKMAELNSNINLEIQLRDADSEIDKYLTNGGKSIPILIVRDADGNDLFHWGPRPTEPQKIVQEHKTSELSAEEKKSELQVWYNKDKGVSVQSELTKLFNN